MDFNALRAQALNSGAEEEAVTVNTRALVDKVLARYSSEWTVLRELIANAADACATKVTIRFTTGPPLYTPRTSSASLLECTIHHSTLRRLEVTNNGNVFAACDWKRLKSIAEGNPDEQKIGAFGVGFYSVFADCENPLVLSGNQGLDFYWDGDALFTRKLQLEEYFPDTVFVLDYRNSTTKVPDLMTLYQFLATSLTFANLSTIELWLDSWNLLTLTKNTEESIAAAIPREIKSTTKRGMMRVTGLQKELVRMSAEVLRTGEEQSKELATAIIPQGQPIQTPINATVHLSILSATVSTSVTPKFSLEIERATKKPPPKNTKLSILWSSSALASLECGGSYLGIFDPIIPSKSGRIFIGFPTHQTTGLLAHISLNSVIPTVERESIDLNAGSVSDWNKEILRVAGIVARVAWSYKMKVLKEKIRQGGGASADGVSAVLAEATQVFEQFAFQDSTPRSRVGKIIQETFWAAGRGPIDVFSSHGVLPSTQVRIAANGVAGFLDGVPTLPEEVVKVAEPFVAGLKANGLILDMSIEDIKKGLRGKALDSKQLLEFLKWTQKKVAVSLSEAKSVLTSVNALVREEGSGDEVARYITLGSIKHYVNDDIIPSNFPVGLDTLPVAYTGIFSKSELHDLGWQELPLKEWIRFLVDTSSFSSQRRNPRHNILNSPEFSGDVLRIVSTRWGYMTSEDQQAIADLLKPHAVMPTKLGMLRPTKSYLSSVTLFQDLANVTGVEGVSETVLVALGVRTMVELDVVLKRLKRGRSLSAASTQDMTVEKWNFSDLINYLLTVSHQLQPDDITLLKNANICHAEGNRSKLYKVCDLYEPADTLRNLGLRVLHWPGTYRPGSKEDEFLRALGLRQIPSVPELILIIAQAIRMRRRALSDYVLQYFINSYSANNYHMFNRSDIKTAFLPLEGEASRYSTPACCFTNEGAAVLGYSILRRDLQPYANKFGVEADPPISWCLNYLKEHPLRSTPQAGAVFSYLGSRKPSDLDNLDQLVGSWKFVPIFQRPAIGESTPAQTGQGLQTALRYIAPRECFLGDHKSFAKIFDFVDFGHDGNRFLRRCGAQYEPSCLDVGRRFIQQPGVLLELLTDPSESYCYWLQWLAARSEHLQRDQVLWEYMRRSPFLLGGTYQMAQGGHNSLQHEGTVRGGDVYYALKSAAEVTIVDDFAAFRCFRNQLCSAPRNHILEQFYIELGSQKLSKLVQVTYNLGKETYEPLAAMKMENLVIERASFFLSDIDGADIKVDAAQLKAGLKVKTTSRISMKRTLKGYSAKHTDSVTAAVIPGDPPTEWILWFTPVNYRIHDVSAAIAQVLLRRPTLSKQLSFDGLLTKDVGALELYGYDVSRILVAQKEELRIAEDQRRREDELRSRLQADGFPINGGLYPFGAGNSFANENSITQNLNTAITASRAFKASSLLSGGSSQQIKEAPNSTYCDVQQAKDLVLATPPPTAANRKAPIFLPPSLISTKIAWLRQHEESADRFTAVLEKCAGSLGVPKECLSLFFEETGTTMAFNSNGSLFFNLRAWEEMGFEQKTGRERERYWFVVFCHEVAHNLVKGHGPEHGYWTETLIVKNIAKLETSPLPNNITPPAANVTPGPARPSSFTLEQEYQKSMLMP
ncbi:MAG: hypothetical protein M1839_009461 [Geoglossum umbratile]|nr:MAG: hypothetical protein M1839_009461 [Geoglossum umbratile]